MKIKDLEVFVMGNPPPGFGGRYFIFVKVTSDDGIVGWGEVYSASIGPEAMRVVIEDVFTRHFAGEAPWQIEALFRKVYSSGFTQRPDLTVIGAFSGLEMACWDMLGKARNLPIWAMLGGKLRDEIRAYTYIYPKEGENAADFYNNADLSAERALELVEEGFTAVKFDPAGPYTVMGGHQPSLYDLEQSEEFCSKIRAKIGARADILFGTHGQFTTSGAQRFLRRLEPYDPLWFEEPIPPDQMAEFAKISQASNIPIATGERLSTKAEFAQVLQLGGASILQPALGRVGGIWEAKKIAIMAEGYNAQMAPHLYAGPIEWLANLQLAASIPNFLIAESILKGEGTHGEIINHAIRFEDGFLQLPDGPGLGADINEDFIRAHPYQGDKLHLEMQATPHDPRRPSEFGGG